jgi:hypothetical protein
MTTAPTDRELAILEFAPENVFREFRSTPAEQGAGGGLMCSKDGRWLMTVQPQVRLYDTLQAEETATLNVPGLMKHVFFAKERPAVLYSCFGRGAYEREFSYAPVTSSGAGRIRWGEEKLVGNHPNSIIEDIVEGGRTYVCHSADAVELWEEADPSRARLLKIRAPLELLAVSQDARWAASPNSFKHQITVWDCRANRLQTNLTARAPTRLWFSPDSAWLVASIENGYCTWDTLTWKPGPAWEARLDSGDPGEVTFAANGRLLVARQEREAFRLLSFPDCRELVTLRPPLVLPIRSACLSADGSRLWLLAAGFRVLEWNVANLRQELGRLGLDWQ